LKGKFGKVFASARMQLSKGRFKMKRILLATLALFSTLHSPHPVLGFDGGNGLTDKTKQELLKRGDDITSREIIKDSDGKFITKGWAYTCPGTPGPNNHAGLPAKKRTYTLPADKSLTGIDETSADCDPGDATIFNGILCFSGEELGCTAVKKAMDSDGRVWRSPWFIGKDKFDSFSRDQFLGA
jgi:hypothetical protein